MNGKNGTAPPRSYSRRGWIGAGVVTLLLIALVVVSMRTTARAEDHARQVEAVWKENKTLKTQMDQQGERIAVLVREMDAISRKGRTDAQGELGQMQALLAQFKQENEDRRRQLDEKLREVKDAAATAARAYGEAGENYALAAREFAAAKQQVGDDVRKAGESVEAARAAKTSAEDAARTAKDDKDAAKAKLDDAKTKFTEAEQRLAEVKQQGDEKLREVKKLADDAATAKTDAATKADEVNRIAADLKTRLAALDQAKNQIDALAQAVVENLQATKDAAAVAKLEAERVTQLWVKINTVVMPFRATHVQNHWRTADARPPLNLRAPRDKEAPVLDPKHGAITVAEFAPGGETLLIGGEATPGTAAVSVLGLTTGATTTHDSPQGVFGSAVGTKSRYVVMDKQGDILVQHLGDGLKRNESKWVMLKTFELRLDETPVRLAAANGVVALATSSGRVGFATEDGRRLQPDLQLGSPPKWMGFSADGTVFAALVDKAVTVSRPGKSGKVRLALDGKAIRTVAFSPDAKQIVTGCDDGAVVVWNIEQSGKATDEPVLGREVVEFQAVLSNTAPADTAIRAVAFAEDGFGERVVVSIAGDGMVRFWSVDRGYLLAEFPYHRGQLPADKPIPKALALAVAPGNQWVAVLNEAGTLFVTVPKPVSPDAFGRLLTPQK